MYAIQSVTRVEESSRNLCTGMMITIYFLVLPATVNSNPISSILVRKCFAIEVEYMWSLGFPLLLSGGQSLSCRTALLVTSLLLRQSSLFASELLLLQCRKSFVQRSLIENHSQDIMQVVSSVDCTEMETVKLQCKSFNSYTWGPWKFVLIKRSSN